MKVSIRRTDRKLDLEAIFELDKQFFGDCLAPHEKTVWWIARSGSDVAGYAGARLAADGSLFFERAAVCKWARGYGLQKRLIRARLRWGRAQGCDYAITYTLDNPPSANSLITCGFKVYAPAVPWIDGDDCTYWRRKL